MGEIYWDMASILVQPYGKEWLVRRKLLHSALTPRALDNYKPLQQAESARLCYQLLQHADRWEALFDRLTASIVFAIAYGHRVDDFRSPVVRQRLEFMQYSSSLNVPGAYLVESFPILKYLPDWMAPWKAEIKRRGRIEAEANVNLVRVIQRDIESANEAPGTAHIFNSLTKQLLEIRGYDRLPTFEDMRNLPYLRAFCKEVLRWRPVASTRAFPYQNVKMAYTPNIKIDITYERLLAKVRNNPAVQFLIATLNEL
ncbi:hypothetical protein ATERTT37_000623 [Aspergillus terreus]